MIRMLDLRTRIAKIKSFSGSIALAVLLPMPAGGVELGGPPASEAPPAGTRMAISPEIYEEMSPHPTARDGHVEAAKALLAAGADPNVKDAAGKAPLHYASDEAVARVLLATRQSGLEAALTGNPAGVLAVTPCPDWMDTDYPHDNTCGLVEKGQLGGGTVIYRMYDFRSAHLGFRGRGIEIAHADRTDRPFLKLHEEDIFYSRPSYGANREASVEFLHVTGSTGGSGSYPRDHILVREHGPWLYVREEYLDELREFVMRELGEYKAEELTPLERLFGCYIFRPVVDFRTLKGSSRIDDDCDCNACGDGHIEFQLRLVHGADGPALVLRGTPRIRPE